MDNIKFTDRQQAFIDGVEFGIDYGLDLSPEDVAEYHKLTGSRCIFTDNVKKYEEYLEKYCKKHGITKWVAHQHLLCRSVAKGNCGLNEIDLKWLDNKFRREKCD